MYKCDRCDEVSEIVMRPAYFKEYICPVCTEGIVRLNKPSLKDTKADDWNAEEWELYLKFMDSGLTTHRNAPAKLMARINLRVN